MIENSTRSSMVEIRQSTRNGVEYQGVKILDRKHEFTLDIDWAFTYHTGARDKEVIVWTGLV